MPFNTLISANVCGYDCAKYVIQQVGTGGLFLGDILNFENKLLNKFRRGLKTFSFEN